MTLLTAPAEIFPQALPPADDRGLAVVEYQPGRDESPHGPGHAHQAGDHQHLTGMTLQGRWVIEDTTTGQRMELSEQEINSLFERFPGRYRVVPSDHLK